MVVLEETGASQFSFRPTIFEQVLSQKLYTLDSVEHAKCIGVDAYINDDQYFSVDWFLYARCCVVANGKEYYENVLKTPSEFPKDMEFEALLSISAAAFLEKTDVEFKGFDTTVSYETYSNKEGWVV